MQEKELQEIQLQVIQTSISQVKKWLTIITEENKETFFECNPKWQEHHIFTDFLFLAWSR